MLNQVRFMCTQQSNVLSVQASVVLLSHRPWSSLFLGRSRPRSRAVLWHGLSGAQPFAKLGLRHMMRWLEENRQPLEQTSLPCLGGKISLSLTTDHYLQPPLCPKGEAGPVWLFCVYWGKVVG